MNYLVIVDKDGVPAGHAMLDTASNRTWAARIARDASEDEPERAPWRVVAVRTVEVTS